MGFVIPTQLLFKSPFFSIFDQNILDGSMFSLWLIHNERFLLCLGIIHNKPTLIDTNDSKSSTTMTMCSIRVTQMILSNLFIHVTIRKIIILE